MLLVIVFLILTMLHNWSNLLILLLLHLLLLHVHLLLLLLHDLIHEDGLVHALRCVKTWRTLTIPLNLMLVTHWDRTITREIRQCELKIFKISIRLEREMNVVK